MSPMFVSIWMPLLIDVYMVMIGAVNLISMPFVTVIWIFLIAQALRPFVNYYTFEDASLERLGEVLSIPSLTFRVKKVGP